MEPMEIERRSMEIIESELKAPLPTEVAPIIKRVIHATADFAYADCLRFSEGVVPLMRGMLKGGALIVTDTNMALAGINKAAAGKLGVTIACFMALEDVAREASARRVTRARVSMERALGIPGPKLIVCGNAPSFLTPLTERGISEGIAVVGTPVGFVNVVEAKERCGEAAFPPSSPWGGAAAATWPRPSSTP
jgi:precorrin-8X/cobalt-precorrin-8 methylmutase